MRKFIYWTTLAVSSHLHASAEVPKAIRDAIVCDKVFVELSTGLPKNSVRANSARLDLEYWRETASRSVVRQPVKTKAGKAAEIIFLDAPGMSVRGYDFSIAYLMIENQVTDWTSCWTSNGSVLQKLRLEDVDGDGVMDVAFQAKAGFFGLRDKRVHSRPGIDGKWLYAYSITDHGFYSLFPDTARDVNVRQSLDTENQPVALEVKGLSKTLRTYELVECTISVKNLSENELPLNPGEWFEIECKHGGVVMANQRSDQRVLPPKESISQTVRLMVANTENDFDIRWKFIPHEPTTAYP